MDSFQPVKAKSGRAAMVGGYRISDDFFLVVSQFCDDAVTSVIHGFPFSKLIKEYFHNMHKFGKCKPENKKRPEYRVLSHRGFKPCDSPKYFCDFAKIYG
jgi:hypothetical protein